MRKYACLDICLNGHYLFLKAHSFPQATLLENCSLFGTDNVHRQISKHIFAPNGGYLFIVTGGQVKHYSGSNAQVVLRADKGAPQTQFKLRA